MATITSNASGLWSAGATWVGGVVPADTNNVVIASGHVVEFDVDQSAFATGIDGITITGTLSLTTTTGTYQLKMKAATTITGAGTFTCGSSGTPIPFAAKHTITGGAGWYINGASGLTMTVYAAEPSIKTVLLTGTEVIGSTVLDVDTDVTGDIWAVGDTIRIDNFAASTAVSEERVIAAAGIAASSITITAGLTAAKTAGSVVSLISRNVKFIGVGATSYAVQSFSTAGKLTIAGGQWTSAAYRIFNGVNAVVSGGSFSGNAYVFFNSNGTTITGGVFSGNTSGVFLNGQLMSVSGGSFSGNLDVYTGCQSSSITGGTFKGNTYLVNGGNDMTVLGVAASGYSSGIVNANVLINGCTFSTGTNGIYGCTGKVLNTTFSSHTQDINASILFLFNCSLGSSTENTAYNTNLTKYAYTESIDHDATAGAFKSWTAGGVTTLQSTTYPTGYTESYQTVLASATIEGYWQKEITIGAGASVTFDFWLRKSASMTYLPRIIVFSKTATDPLAGGAGLNTFTMTNSVDTWENNVYTYTNSTAEDVTLIIRSQGMNATGNMFSVVNATQINVDLTILTANVAVIDGIVDEILIKTDDNAALILSK